MSHRSTPSLNSGDGSRPTTDGTVGNIGAAEKFLTRRNAVGEEVSEPANPEAMAGKKQDAESAKHDDSDAFNLHENLDPAPNTDLTNQSHRDR